VTLVQHSTFVKYFREILFKEFPLQSYELGKNKGLGDLCPSAREDL